MHMQVKEVMMAHEGKGSRWACNNHNMGNLFMELERLLTPGNID